MADKGSTAGLVVRAQSGYFDVETEHGLLVARVRGRETQGSRSRDLIALGDRVQLELLDDGTAMIEHIEPRSRTLARKSPGREIEQVLVANLDQALFVFSCFDPEPNLRLLDRLLVTTEEQQIPTLICANKIDLSGMKLARLYFEMYEKAGYPVFYVSARTGKGVRPLRKALGGRLSVFAGPSGAGKTSLLNAIQPDLGLRVGEISAGTRKGKHTTVVPKLVRLKSGGYVADTPGIKAFALWDIEPEELDGYFREIKPLVANCAFSDCTHMHEPDCAVIQAVEDGRVHPERYDSYQRLRLGELD